MSPRTLPGRVRIRLSGTSCVGSSTQASDFSVVFAMVSEHEDFFYKLEKIFSDDSVENTCSVCGRNSVHGSVAWSGGYGGFDA